jgi:hypothetical protein
MTAMKLIAIPAPSSLERSRLLSADLIRRQTLARLYERRAAVEDLIRSLEDYQRANEPRKEPCISVVPKY